MNVLVIDLVLVLPEFLEGQTNSLPYFLLVFFADLKVFRDGHRFRSSFVSGLGVKHFIFRQLLFLMLFCLRLFTQK